MMADTRTRTPGSGRYAVADMRKALATAVRSRNNTSVSYLDMLPALDSPATALVTESIGIFHCGRNALPASAFGRRPVPNSEIHAPIAQSASRTLVRPGVVVA